MLDLASHHLVCKFTKQKKPFTKGKAFMAFSLIFEIAKRGKRYFVCKAKKSSQSRIIKVNCKVFKGARPPR